MKLNGAAQDILAVLTGKQAVQTQSAVAVDTQTQDWLTQLVLIGAGALVLVKVLGK
jgi:hypothetical protein